MPHPKRRAVTALLALAVLGLLVAASIASAPGEGVTVGSLAPDFTVTDFRGQTVRLSDLRGKVVYLLFQSLEPT